METKICGLEKEKIRKAYFSNKLEKLLTEIQASGEHSPEEYENLKTYLSILQKQDEKLSENLASFLPKIEVEGDSTLDELSKETLSEAELQELNKEQANRENAVKLAGKMLKGLFNKFYDKTQKSPDQNELLDMAFELLSLEWYIMRDVLYKERLYRKKIVEVERTGKQRKLAEEAAKTTIEYRNYFLANGLSETVKEFILLSKKRYKDA